MKFQKQQYQIDCVQNIVDAFKDFDVKLDDKEVFLEKYKKIREEKGFPVKKITDKFQLDVLMETGTGKTFTYLNTIFELHKQYNIKKFIIIVPRRAIRQGVIQNIKLTENYFYQEYNERIKLYTYEGKKSIGNINNHYIKSEEELSLLVLTNSSFDKEKNILHQSQENLFQYGSILKAIQKQKPIIFIDEPHLLKGDKFITNFKDFTSPYIRFGATFPKQEEHQLSNMIYCLDSISSFRKYLVKKIRVSTIFKNHDEIKFSQVSGRGKEQKITLFYCDNNIEKKEILKIGEDIGIKINKDYFKGISIRKANQKEIFLSNQSIYKVASSYQLDDEEIRVMIKKTIEFHFEKEEKLFSKGIKTLSLFFIPKVEDFRGDSPRVKIIFEEEYKSQRDKILKKTNLNKEYGKYLEKDFNEQGDLQVHQGYFSGDKGSTRDDKDTNGIDIILNDKEKLLSFDTPLRFIFSVWALQEGWDNPNIFNLCKLSNTDKDISRRQQIGRGLRIAVNQKGIRQTLEYLANDEKEFYNINTLDLVVSSQEKNFIEEIQKEIQENSFTICNNYLTSEELKEKGLYDREISKLLGFLEDKKTISWEEENKKYFIQGSIRECLKKYKNEIDFLGDETRFQDIVKKFEDDSKNAVENRNAKKIKVKIRQKKLAKFKQLWETINKKVTITYKDIEEERIRKNIAEKFNKETIEPVKIFIQTKEYNHQDDKIEDRKGEYQGDVNFFYNNNFLDFIDFFVEGEKLPLSFILKLFNELDKEKIKNNPKKAKELLIHLIKEQIHQSIIQKVKYNFVKKENKNDIFISSLTDAQGNYLKELEHTLLGKYIDKEERVKDEFLYDKLVYDSNIEKDSIIGDFVEINNKKITVFAKLPKINIPTPYKMYNPDFAYLLESDEGKTLFLIVETKGYKYEKDIPEEEQNKIDYAKKFFKRLQEELPNIDIKYKTRLNNQSLRDMLS